MDERSDAEAARLAAANERLLVRLALDLHDGPLQQLHVLGQDVRLLRGQALAVTEGEHGRQLAGRFDDVEAQLAEIHRDVRDLAQSLEPRTLLQQPLPAAVERELAAFARRTEIEATTELDGSFAELSASQRIALLRVLQEALSNVRRHSGAASVAVALRHDEAGVTMEVRDDGRGFDPAAVRDANEDGGLGLDGMRERLRLLGGTVSVDSGPGGPTVVRATVPAWRPGAGA